MHLKLFKTKTQNYAREVPWRTLVKGASIIMMAPLMLLTIFAFHGALDLQMTMLGVLIIFVLSILFVRPYLANLSALTEYVRELSLDKKIEPPNLTFLNNVEELSEAVSQLHNTWEVRKKQIEANIAESKILINSLPDIIIMLDENYDVIRTNSAAKATFGGKHFKETLDSIIHDASIQALAHDVMQGYHAEDVEFYLPEPYDRHYFVQIKRFPVYSPGRIALVIVMHDITERKHTEQMLSDFVANASHEIRTPLTSVMGFIETLQTHAKDDTEASEEFLAIMSAQTERMSKLVNGLLSLSQIERNMHVRPITDVDIISILEELRAQMDISAAEKDMFVELKINGDIPKVRGDATEYSQVFENLINNAIKYGHEGTAVTVTVVLADNDYDEEPILADYDQVVAISITDKGEGIPEKHIPRLTERFYRVDAARSREVGGTGLGLSIVKHILDRHHGVLHISSKQGKGSTFMVLLPVE